MSRNPAIARAARYLELRNQGAVHLAKASTQTRRDMHRRHLREQRQLLSASLDQSACRSLVRT